MSGCRDRQYRGGGHSIGLVILYFIGWFLYQPIVVFADDLPTELFWPDRYVFHRAEREQGLPSQNVTSVTQDRLGFMWFGTYDGLARYDGQRTVVYRSSKNDLNTVSGNTITDLTMTPDGLLWIGTLENGVSSFDFRSAKFTRYLDSRSKKSGYQKTGVLFLHTSLDGTLWVGTRDGKLLRLHIPENKFEEEHFSMLGQNYVVSAVADGPKGKIWIGTLSGDLFLYDPHTKHAKSYYIGDYISALMYEPQANVLYIGTDWNGMVVMNLTTMDQTRYTHEHHQYDSLPGNEISDFLFDPGGQLWIATSGGLARFNQHAKTFLTYHPERQLAGQLVASL
ncbi:MAG: hypothetical protein IPJ88_10600 [Myxococcales bacterium]|nr:MAG: hypothetical protein IPJ88_10600 [Myxococcales bacterium]